MYKGYTVFNQLEKVYLEPVGRVIMLYNLFEHDSSRAERGVVEVIQVDKKYAHKLDMPHTLLDDHNEFVSFTIILRSTIIKIQWKMNFCLKNQVKFNLS